MARKPKGPPEKPSKAYLVSFGDTMTALLAFFIVLNSFAKEQTGANMYTGTGSFVNSLKSAGTPGGSPGNRSAVLIQKTAPTPLYCVESPGKEKDPNNRLGPDSNPDSKRVIDRQTEQFKRFLNEVNKEFGVDEKPPTKCQIVFDSFEKLDKAKKDKPHRPLQINAIQLSAEAIMKLGREDFELEIIVWANMPSDLAMIRGMNMAMAIQNQIDSIFNLTESQQKRITVSAKPWLFSDAARPKISLVISRLELTE